MERAKWGTQLTFAGRRPPKDPKRRQLFDEFRMEYIYDAHDVDCDACGGKRFVVCGTCSGTKRGRVMFGKAMKCAMCNENGLMACPSCNTDELERSMTMAPAGYSGKLDRRSIVRS